MRRRFWAGIIGVAALVGAGFGCRQNAPAPPANPAPPQNASRPATTETTETTPSSKTPIKDALEKVIAQEAVDGGLLPKDVKLRGIALHDGVATLDFSQEFNKLANMGDTPESQAQKLLRRTLAQFPEIEKMRVTVEGKPFESQATDWNTPFPVREADGSGTSEGARTTRSEDLSH